MGICHQCLLRRQRSGCWIQGRFCGIFGYSDDNWLLAPSLNALQDMLDTCQEYAEIHNLKFSTDKNSKKSKTKCMAFLKCERDLPNLMLCDNPLPWVDSLLHLGTKVCRKQKGGRLDIRMKEAAYIERNCSLNQEFSFAHPLTKIKINRIYNCHFSGGQLWDLFGAEAQKFFSTFNRSIKVMADLPYATHRYLIEPVSEQKHMSIQLIQNFVGFMEKIRNSTKQILKMLYQITRKDVKTVTGSNLRNILCLTDLCGVDMLDKNSVANLKYSSVDEDNRWRVSMVKELIDMKNSLDDPLNGWEPEELDEILEFACF